MIAAPRLLRLQAVELFLEGRRILGPLNCEVVAGRPTTLMGPSGCGKSSLLNWLIGALPPGFSARGGAFLDDKPLIGLPTNLRRLGILFQDDVLFPHLNVAENLAFALPRGLNRQERLGRVDAALAEAELTGLGARPPGALSGGQRARVALMRTLLAEPGALLLDEPFAKLDAALRDRFRRLVFEKAASRNLPVLLVSHDPADGLAAGGPVIKL